MIRIRSEAWRVILAHARASYPEECCGVLIGEARAGIGVAEAQPFENASTDSRRSHYALRPSQLLAADRDARARGLAIVGVYHSHPDGGTVFSPEDLANAWSWYFYFVLSIRNGEFAGAAAWMADGMPVAARELPVLIEP